MMDIRTIKNDRQFFWTNHAKHKLLQYGLSPTAIKNVLKHPERTETGVAPETMAVMRRRDTKKTKRELWVMIQKTKSKVQKAKIKSANQNLKLKYSVDNFAIGKTKIISAWIYPGVSPKDREIFVPEDVLAELNNLE